MAGAFLPLSAVKPAGISPTGSAGSELLTDLPLDPDTDIVSDFVGGGGIDIALCMLLLVVSGSTNRPFLLVLVDVTAEDRLWDAGLGGRLSPLNVLCIRFSIVTKCFITLVPNQKFKNVIFMCKLSSAKHAISHSVNNDHNLQQGTRIVDGSLCI